jgi:single stranded DNA-binding protein
MSQNSKEKLIVNLLVLAGNVGRDVEYVPQDGTTDERLSFTLGHNVFSPSGEKLRTDWVRVVAWGKEAQEIAKLKLKRGDNVQVAGRFGLRHWQDAQGNSRQIVELNAKKVEVIRAK